MICKVCHIEFNTNHFNQKCCSDACRIEARKVSRVKHKQTDKWKDSNDKWVKSERRKINEKSYQQKPEAKKKAVVRSMRTLKNNPSLQEKKRMRDKDFSRSQRGKEINHKSSKAYRQTGNGRKKTKEAKYRRRNYSAGKLDWAAWDEKLKALNNQCQHCFTTDNITIDHIIPLVKGGTNQIYNLQPLCRSCNCKKSDKIIEYAA